MTVLQQQKICNEKSLVEWLRQIRDSEGEGLKEILTRCVNTFLTSEAVLDFRNDERLVELFIQYGDIFDDFESAHCTMEEKNIGFQSSTRYICYALYLERKRKFMDAENMYRLGLSRNAQPYQWLKAMHSKFCERVAELVKFAKQKKQDVQENTATMITNPWDFRTGVKFEKLLKEKISCYKGFSSSKEKYREKLSIPLVKKTSQNKTLELGGNKYSLQGLSGEGAYGKVFKAFAEGYTDNTVALKIQNSSCAWEFYMYRQLDERIYPVERASFGSAYKIHSFSDCSILVCNYIEYGTLQETINLHLGFGKCMDEALCVFYTIEMLHILESLHSANLIHGDFKPDNLLIRYGREEISKDWNPNRDGEWKDRGLCLIDFGKGIDMSLFPKRTEFLADSKTSGFRCIEMMENRPWTFQADTYCVCAIAHMMLHGSYMELVKDNDADGHCFYRPKIPLKRYWNRDLWGNFFATLLNIKSCQENPDLSVLRRDFEDYLSSNSGLRRKVKQILMQQRLMYCKKKMH